MSQDTLAILFLQECDVAKKKREETPEIALSVGRAIARQRKLIGKTQRTVAEEMETGVETISRLESGSILQTVDRLEQLSVVLNCPITSFFWDEDDGPEVQAATIADMLRTLPAEHRKNAVQFMAELVRVLRNQDEPPA